MLSNTFMNLAVGMNNLLESAFDVTQFTNIIFDILTYALIVVAAAGTIYAIILGVNMARADSADKREEAKQRIVYTLIGIAICVVLIIVFYIVSQNIESWIDAIKTNNKKNDADAFIGLL